MQVGSRIARRVLSRPNCFTTRKVGIMPPLNIIVNVMKNVSWLRKRKRLRDIT